MLPRSYIDNALRTEASYDAPRGRLNSDELFRLLHGAIGLGTEAAELALHVQVSEAGSNYALVDESSRTDWDRTFRAHILEECGDLLWYAALIVNATGIHALHHIQVDPAMGWKEACTTTTINAGNILDVVKRVLFYGKTLDSDRLGRLLTSVIDCVIAIAIAFNFTLQEAMDANIAKLRARYPEKFTEEKAANRNLNIEFQAFAGFNRPVAISDAISGIDTRADRETVTTFASGAVSGKVPRLQLIPVSSILALANRMEYGIERKADGAWNALADNQAPLRDRAFLIDRLAHSALHSYNAIGRLLGVVAPLPKREADAGGDAGAIMFGGALLAAVEDLESREAALSGV